MAGQMVLNYSAPAEFMPSGESCESENAPSTEVSLLMDRLVSPIAMCSWCQWTDQTMFCGQEKASHPVLTLLWQPAPLPPESQLEKQPVILEKLELFLRNRKCHWSF